jgi:hypothetical protein
MEANPKNSPRAETLDLDLSGEDCGLIVVEQRKERNASQYIRTTAHLDLLRTCK